MTPAERLAAERGRAKTPATACRLGEFRRRAGLKLKDVSEAVGLSLAWLNALELGRGRPSLATARTLAAFYGCRVDDLWPDPAGG